MLKLKIYKIFTFFGVMSIGKAAAEDYVLGGTDATNGEVPWQVYANQPRENRRVRIQKQLIADLNRFFAKEIRRVIK